MDKRESFPPQTPPGSSSSSSSHGRISSGVVISGPAACFPWEYTVLPVRCHHLPLCAAEEQGREDLSPPGRTEVVQIPERHLRVPAASRLGPPRRRPQGRYRAARIHALHIQDILGRREARTKRKLFPLLQIRQHHHKFCGQRNRLVSLRRFDLHQPFASVLCHSVIHPFSSSWIVSYFPLRSF